MRTFYLLLLLILIPTTTSCEKDNLFSENSENHFFLENEGATMPVLVKGNTNSKTFIILLHGGPGGSAVSEFAHKNVFKTLESDYAIVYYDQRCTGFSQGNCNPNDLKVSDFNNDIDKLILLLDSIYGNDSKFFLLGHSWGGTLALDYLINGSEKYKVKGCIQTNGPHNYPMVYEEEKEIVIFYAQQQIALGNHTEEWQKILDEVTVINPNLSEDQEIMRRNAYKTENLLTSVDSIQTTPLSPSIVKHLSSIFLTTTSDLNNNIFLQRLSKDYNVTHKLHQITTPMALYWGYFDLVVPRVLGREIFSKLGTTEKELFFFPKSFHAPMVSENEAYQMKVKDFVETYK